MFSHVLPHDHSFHILDVFAQVFLGPNGEVEEYAVIPVQQNAAISSDLILDQTEEHIFIMTHNMVRTQLSSCVSAAPCLFSHSFTTL